MISIGVLIVVFLALGLPVDGWVGYGVLAGAVAALLAGHVRTSGRRWLAALAVAAAAMAWRALLPLPAIDEGHSVHAGGTDRPVFAQALPAPVLERLEEAWRSRVGQAVFNAPARPFAMEPESLWRPSPLSRRVASLDFADRFDLRAGIFNDNRYNTYGGTRPERHLLPYYLRADIPAELAARSELCWRGEVFLPAGQGWSHLVHAEPACAPLAGLAARNGVVTLWAVDAVPERPLALTLDMPLGTDLLVAAHDAAGPVAALAVLALLVRGIAPRRFAWVAASLALSTLMAALATRGSPLGSGFLLMEGGNDGLVHSGYAREIFAAALAGDWRAALQGVEPVFDFQAGYRYVLAAGYALFGNTVFGGLLLLGLVPVALYPLVRDLLGLRWARWLMVVFLAVPAFEAFGFLQYYFAYQFVRGFAEPLGYLLFLAGMAATIRLFPADGKSEPPAAGTLAWVGLAFAASVALRANLAPGAALYRTALGLALLWRRRVGGAVALTAGFLPMGLVPLHNWVFGTPETFYLLTRSAARKFNVGATPADWAQALRALAGGEWHDPAIGIVTTHWLKEMKPSEPWFYLVLGLAIAMTVRRATSLRLKVVGLTALALQGLTLFYYVGGRYGYVTWILTLLVALAWIRAVAVPWVRQRRQAAVSASTGEAAA